MAFIETVRRIPRIILDYAIIILSMTGFVPRGTSLPRAFSFALVVAFSFYIGHYYAENSTLGIVYFIVSEILYVGFLWLVLVQNGLRLWFIKRWNNPEEGFLAYQTVLGILFFLNGSSLGFIAASTPSAFFGFIGREWLLGTAALMTAAGFIIKIWSAKVVSIDIYYWKDMFLGRKICEFVETGPYRFLSNPMYGLGQLPAYALGIWYGSWIGLLAAFVNQLLIFSFYLVAERSFIRRVYLSGAEPPPENHPGTDGYMK